MLEPRKRGRSTNKDEASEQHFKGCRDGRVYRQWALPPEKLSMISLLYVKEVFRSQSECVVHSVRNIFFLRLFSRSRNRNRNKIVNLSDSFPSRGDLHH